MRPQGGGKPLSTSKYIAEIRPGHPTAMKDGRVRVHRATLYDKIGPGIHDCHWCGNPVEWFSPNRYDALVADHVDTDTWNNDPENLVPACYGCNGARSRRALTHCLNGHEFTEANTYLRPDGGGRQCRECGRDRDKSRVRVRTGPGRQQGTSHWMSKLTEDDVRSIRDTYGKGGVTLKEIAELHKVSISQVSSIVNKKSWRHIE